MALPYPDDTASQCRACPTKKVRLQHPTTSEEATCKLTGRFGGREAFAGGFGFRNGNCPPSRLTGPTINYWVFFQVVRRDHPPVGIDHQHQTARHPPAAGTGCSSGGAVDPRSRVRHSAPRRPSNVIAAASMGVTSYSTPVLRWEKNRWERGRPRERVKVAVETEKKIR